MEEIKVQCFSVIVTVLDTSESVTITDDFSVLNCNFGPLGLTKSCQNKCSVTKILVTITETYGGPAFSQTVS